MSLKLEKYTYKPIYNKDRHRIVFDFSIEKELIERVGDNLLNRAGMDFDLKKNLDYIPYILESLYKHEINTVIDEGLVLEISEHIWEGVFSRQEEEYKNRI